MPVRRRTGQAHIGEPGSLHEVLHLRAAVATLESRAETIQAVVPHRREGKVPVEAERQLRREPSCTCALEDRAATRERPVDRRGDERRYCSSGRAWLATDKSSGEVYRLKESAEDWTPLVQRVVEIKEYEAPRSDRADNVRETNLWRLCVVEYPERIGPIDRVLSQWESTQIRLDAGDTIRWCVRSGHLDASPEIDRDDPRSSFGNLEGPAAGTRSGIENG